MGPLKHGGLALATSIAQMVNLGLLLWLLRRKIGCLGLRKVGVSLAKILLSTAVMALVSWVTFRAMSYVMPGAGFTAKSARVFIPLGAGFLGYLAFAYILKTAELAELWHEFRRRGA